jgi:hypothetical protein
MTPNMTRARPRASARRAEPIAFSGENELVTRGEVEWSLLLQKRAQVIVAAVSKRAGCASPFIPWAIIAVYVLRVRQLREKGRNISLLGIGGRGTSVLVCQMLGDLALLAAVPLTVSLARANE